MAPKMIYVADIKPGKGDWQILVRIIHLWKIPDKNDVKETNSIEMVLLDEKRSKIHATIKGNKNISKFEKLMEEGCTYLIENILVAANDPKFKTTRHKYKLMFTSTTNPTKSETGNIPLNHFDFVGFPEILEGKDEGFLFDVIGHVVEKGEINETDNNGKKRKLLDITLEDIESNRVSCTLWEDFANQMYQHLYNKPSSGPIIVILQLCKMKFFNGKFGISNAYHGTKLLINPNLKEATDYKERLDSGKITSSQVISSMSGHATVSVHEDLLQTPMMTISDLMEATEDCFGSVLAEVVELDSDWYYQACQKCHKKVEAKEKKLWCKNCENYVVAGPWIKLQLQVIDQTGSTTFTMFENMVIQYVGKATSDLIKTKIKGNTSACTPLELQSMVDKTFLFKVHFNRKWQSYTIKRMSDDKELLDQFQMLHSLKDSAGDEDTELNSSLAPKLNENVQVVVEGADSNLKVDKSQEAKHNSIECLMVEQENTPSSKATAKRSADGIDTSILFEDTGTQASSTKIPKIVEVKKEPNE